MDQELGGHVNGLGIYAKVGYMQKWDPKIIFMQKWDVKAGLMQSWDSKIMCMQKWGAKVGCKCWRHPQQSTENDEWFI